MRFFTKFTLITILLFSTFSSADTINGVLNPLLKVRSGISMKIDTVSVPAGFTGSVTIPVKVTNFKNIGAVSLKISYDASKLQFTSFANIYGNAKFLYSDKDGVITIGWYDVTPANIPDGKYFDMVFQLKGTPSAINFKTEACEIADGTGNTIICNYINGYVSSQTTSVKKNQKKLGYQLENNYPNPFNPVTRIGYSVPAETRVVLKVFNILGTEIQTLVNKIQPAGSYFVDFYAADLPSGIYVYTMQAGDFTQSSKMTLLR